MPATQRQIRDWCQTAVPVFQKYFPCTPPPIVIGSERTYMDKRVYCLELTGKHEEIGWIDEYDSTMEMICGDKGYAILIRQKFIPSAKENEQAEYWFRHFLWHELGHYFAISSETDNLHRFNDPDGAEGKAQPNKQKGYWMWSEFIAEAISCYVGEQEYLKDADWDNCTWEPDFWRGASNTLVDMLEAAFQASSGEIDEYSLGMYFSHLLADPLTKRYVQAAYDGKLMVSNWPLRPKLMEPGSIDPTGLEALHLTMYKPVLDHIEGEFTGQLKQEKFWICDEEFLEESGRLLTELEKQVKKQKLKSITPEREKFLRGWMGDKQFEAMMRYYKDERR